MRSPGVDIDETVVVVGSSAPTLLDRVHIALRDLEHHEIVRQSPVVLQIARTDKSVLGRRLSVCVVSAATQPQQVTVSLIGNVLPSVSALIKGALHGAHERGAPIVATFAPAVRPGAAPTQFVPPVDWFVQSNAQQRPPPPPPPSVPGIADGGLIGTPGPYNGSNLALPPPNAATIARPSSGPVLVAPDGRTLPVRGTLVIGRAPVPKPDDVGPVEVVFTDHELSKTHCAIGVSVINGDMMAWLEDRHSTNGSALASAGGPLVRVEAGTRVYAKLPAVIEVGATRLTVELRRGTS